MSFDYPPRPLPADSNHIERNGVRTQDPNQQQPVPTGRESFDEDTEALLHATDQPVTPLPDQKSHQVEDEKPGQSNSRREKPDVLARPLRNAGYKTPSVYLTLLGIFALGCLGYLLSVLFVGFTRYGRTLRVNVILMVSDGFGPTSETMARDYIQYLSTSAPDHPQALRWPFEDFKDNSGLVNHAGFGSLPLDALLVGQSRTRSSNSLVTDSAAGATAFSCGIKTYNGGVAIDPESKDPCGTILEAAKHKNFLTGLVTTSRITHATPAAFYAHTVDRDLESDIAEFLVANHPLGLQVDYALGGGRCFFLPQSHPETCRSDDKDLFILAEQQEHDHHAALKPSLVSSYQAFTELKEDVSALGTVGLFNSDHLNYEVDRANLEGDQREPSLKEMTQKALNTLRKAAGSRKSPGFFLMVEGSRIDMAAHSNDPVAHLQDILAYQETVAEVHKFVDEQNKNGWPTVMISVSDHETGGMSLGTQRNPAVYPDYEWFPDILANYTASSIAVSQHITDSSPNSADSIRNHLRDHYGLRDPTSDEINRLQNAEQDVWELDLLISQMTSRRAEIGWSTHGHSGADVGLYALGYKAKQLHGSVDNTEMGRFMANVMELDLSGTTDLLMRTAKAWHEKDKSSPDNTVGIAHYHGHDALSHGNGTGGSATSSHLYLDHDSRASLQEASIPAANDTRMVRRPRP